MGFGAGCKSLQRGFVAGVLRGFWRDCLRFGESFRLIGFATSLKDFDGLHSWRPQLEPRLHCC